MGKPTTFSNYYIWGYVWEKHVFLGEGKPLIGWKVTLLMNLSMTVAAHADTCMKMCMWTLLQTFPNDKWERLAGYCNPMTACVLLCDLCEAWMCVLTVMTCPNKPNDRDRPSSLKEAYCWQWGGVVCVLRGREALCWWYSNCAMTNNVLLLYEHGMLSQTYGSHHVSICQCPHWWHYVCDMCVMTSWSDREDLVLCLLLLLSQPNNELMTLTTLYLFQTALLWWSD